MHTLAAANDILQAVLREAENHIGRSVRTIKVTITGDHVHDCDSLQFCLEALLKGTAAEGASVAVLPVLEAEREQEQVAVTLELD